MSKDTFLWPVKAISLAKPPFHWLIMIELLFEQRIRTISRRNRGRGKQSRIDLLDLPDTVVQPKTKSLPFGTHFWIDLQRKKAKSLFFHYIGKRFVNIDKRTNIHTKSPILYKLHGYFNQNLQQTYFIATGAHQNIIA